MLGLTHSFVFTDAFQKSSYVNLGYSSKSLQTPCCHTIEGERYGWLLEKVNSFSTKTIASLKKLFSSRFAIWKMLISCLCAADTFFWFPLPPHLFSPPQTSSSPALYTHKTKVSWNENIFLSLTFLSQSRYSFRLEIFFHTEIFICILQ